MCRPHLADERHRPAPPLAGQAGTRRASAFLRAVRFGAWRHRPLKGAKKATWQMAEKACLSQWRKQTANPNPRAPDAQAKGGQPDLASAKWQCRQRGLHEAGDRTWDLSTCCLVFTEYGRFVELSSKVILRFAACVNMRLLVGTGRFEVGFILGSSHADACAFRVGLG